MEAIDIITNSEVSSVRSVTPTIETDSLKDVTTPPIYFGVETEPFFFLSSFFPSTLSLGHHEFLTAEAFFQAAKFSKHPNLVLAMKNTKSSKDMLYKIQHWTDCIPEDWEEKRLPIMKEIQELKFAQHKQLRDRLVQTGDAELIYRSKTDSFFGCGQDNQGLNHLGRILMNLRSAFQACPEPESTLLSTCFDLNLPRPDPQSISTVWCAHNASEKWYPHTKLSLKEITITPAISDAPAYEFGFLHGIAHGDKPWKLEILVELREEVHEDVYVEIYYNSPQSFNYYQSKVPSCIALASESRTSISMANRCIYIYDLTIELDRGRIETPGCTASVTLTSSHCRRSRCYTIRFNRWE